MTAIPLARADYNRTVAKEARIQSKNRYFENNPVLTGQGSAAMISRPGLVRWLNVGDGPIRGIFSSPGSFKEALFVVSGGSWFRVDKSGVVTLLTDGVFPGTGAVSMAGTGYVNGTPEFMYLADGRNLWVYTEAGFAKGIISGSPANGDVVRIGAVYYQFTTGSVDAGTPAGTLAAPWLVKKSLTDALSWRSFGYAVTGNGTVGTDYSTVLVANPVAITSVVDPTAVTVRARNTGATGNAIVTTETGAGMAWAFATLTGGGLGNVNIVATPDDVGMISVGYIQSRVVCVPAQGQGINGRFYWINPGATIIDALDYATAESAPDPIFSVVVFGDQFWLPGSSTTEVWYFTGDATTPVLRLKGVSFNRGTWEGAAIQVKDSMIIVDSDGGVFQVSGGINRISTPDIEEGIRMSIQYQSSLVL